MPDDPEQLCIDIVSDVRERRITEAKRLREVWRSALFGSRPMKPWHLLTEERQGRWLALADDSLNRKP